MFNYLADLTARMLLRVFPNTFATVLKRGCTRGVLRKLNDPKFFHLSRCELPGHVACFEDLISLFWSSPLNRGVLRMDLDEAAALYKAVRQMRGARGVEIGRYYGGSTLLLACAVGPAGRLISIDIAPQDDAALRRLLKRLGWEDRVVLVVEDANRVEFRDALDFLFVDGDHTYWGASRDHNRWVPLVRVGGLVAYHDMAAARQCATQEPGLRVLRDQILKQQPLCLRLIEEVGSLAIFQRPEAPWSPI